MKRYSLLFLSLLGATSLWAQSNSRAVPTNVEAGNYQISGVKIDLPISEKEMEEIFENKLKANGARKKSDKWKTSRKYRFFEGVKIGQVSSQTLDYYYLVDGSKENATVTVFMSTGHDNFLSPSQDPQAFKNVAEFLESLNADVDSKNWENRVAEQEEVVEKSTKKLTDSEESLENMQNDLTKLQQAIEDKKIEIETKKAELQTQQEVLESIRSERK